MKIRVLKGRLKARLYLKGVLGFMQLQSVYLFPTFLSALHERAESALS
jgi:hypothetical protein